MKHLFKYGLAFGVLWGMQFAAPDQAHAQRVSSMQAGRLLQLCSRSSGVQICEAYITGMADSVALTKEFDKNQGDAAAPAGFCIPPATTGMQMRGVVVAWMKGNKERLHEPVGGLVYTALHEGYPCKAGDSKPKEENASKENKAESKEHQ